MKHVTKILAVFGLLALSASAQARSGGWGDGKVLFASEGQFSHDNSTTASLYTAATAGRWSLADGSVIVMEASCTIGTVDNEGATLTIGASYGGTDMLTAAVIMDDGRLFIKMVGIVRSPSSSASSAGTILWSIQAWADNTTAGSNNATAAFVSALDSSADSIDTGYVKTQGLGISFDWTAASSANTLDVEQFIVRVY